MVIGVASRLTERVRTAVALVRAGITPTSVLLIPLRRRMGARDDRIDLRSGLTIRAPRSEPLVYLFGEIWIDDCYGTSTIAMAPGQGAAIVDVGAHVGLFALRAATLYPGLRVIALEPAKHVFEYLSRNVRDNHLPQIVAMNVACGGRRGEAVLLSVGPEVFGTLYGNGREIARVEMVVLDDVIKRHQIETIPLLKLDCEGAEYEILYGASAAALACVERIAMEYHLAFTDGQEPERLVGFLRSHGFDVRTAPSRGLGFLHAWRPGLERRPS